MKKFPLLVFALISILPAFAQNPAYNCYTEYYIAFRDRGARPVPDGVHKVVVSLRKEGACTCLLGKISVKEGKPVNDLQLEKEDGTLEKFVFVPSERYSKSETRFLNYVSNGMSPTYLSANEELIDLFFYEFLNDAKSSGFKHAPPVK